MAFHVEISFKKSRSKDFSLALKYARKFDHFQETDGGYKLEIYNVEELFLKWVDFSILLHYTRKWTGTSFSFNDIVCRTNEVFYALQEVKNCYKQYKAEFDKQGFCDSTDWGCFKLKSIRRFVDTGYGPCWYRFGSFSAPGIWCIDKSRIKNVLLEEARMKCLEACPVFNVSSIMDILTKLPDKIFIDDKKWHIIYRTDYLAKGEVYIPVGIEHVEQDPEEIEIEQPEFIKNGLDFNVKMPENLSSKSADEWIDWYFKNKDSI